MPYKSELNSTLKLRKQKFELNKQLILLTLQTFVTCCPYLCLCGPAHCCTNFPWWRTFTQIHLKSRSFYWSPHKSRHWLRFLISNLTSLVSISAIVSHSYTFSVLSSTDFAIRFILDISPIYFMIYLEYFYDISRKFCKFFLKFSKSDLKVRI